MLTDCGFPYEFPIEPGVCAAVDDSYSFFGQGGLIIGGQIDPPGMRLSHTGQGGLIFGSSAPHGHFTFTPSGGLVLGGEAIASRNAYAAVADGGLILSGEAEVVSLSYFFGPGGPSVFDNGYQYRKLVKVPSGTVESDLTNFPVLVEAVFDDYQIHHAYESTGGLTLAGESITSSSAYSYVGSGGLTLSASLAQGVTCGNEVVEQGVFSVVPTGGLGFGGSAPVYYALGRHDYSFETYCDCEPLDFETESYDATTGTLKAWVRFPSVGADVDNVAFLYYKGSEAGPSRGDVWANSFEAVYHLSELTDSTTNGLDGEVVAETLGGTDATPAPIVGKIATARNFTGDYFTTDSDSINANDSITVEAWVRLHDDTPVRQVIFSRGETDGENGYGWNMLLGIDDSQKVWAKVQAICGGSWEEIEVSGDTDLAVDTWHHVAAVWTTAEGLAVYLDGEQDGLTETGIGSLVPYSGVNQIGRLDNTLYTRADVDELRLSRASRSSAWIKASYDTSDDPTTFALIGHQEHAIGLSGCPVVVVDRAAYVPTGGLTLAGSATTSLFDLLYIAEGSGGLTLSGSAPIHYRETASGGLSLSGSADAVVNGYRATGSGGLSLSGSARLAVNYNLAGSSGLSLASSGVAKLGYVWTASGGLSLSGTTTATVGRVVAGSGGLSMGGTAQPSWVEYGSISLSGSATSKVHYRATATGGISLRGSAIAQQVGLWRGSGGLALSGTTTTSLNVNVVGSGGLSMGGTAQPSWVEYGSISLSGSAVSKVHYGTTPAGGIGFGSSGVVHVSKRGAASGGLTLAGSAPIGRRAEGSGGMSFGGSSKVGIKLAATGGLTLSGSAPIGRKHVGSGSLVLSGSADLSTYFVQGSGGLSLAGSAIAATPFFHVIGSGGLRFVRPVLIDLGGTIETYPMLGGELSAEPAIGGKVEATSGIGGEIEL